MFELFTFGALAGAFFICRPHRMQGDRRNLKWTGRRGHCRTLRHGAGVAKLSVLDGRKVGAVVRLAAFDDVPTHRFVVHAVGVDCVTGVALNGPMQGQYGEPALSLITEVLQL